MTNSIKIEIYMEKDFVGDLQIVPEFKLNLLKIINDFIPNYKFINFHISRQNCEKISKDLKK